LKGEKRKGKERKRERKKEKEVRRKTYIKKREGNGNYWYLASNISI
jgi:hypothetical protein